MKKTFLIAAVLFTFSYSAIFAQEEGHFYIGAGIGNTFFSSEFEDALDEVKDISENSTAWKLFLGYQLNNFLHVEGGYRDFGVINSQVGIDNLKTHTTGWDFEFLGRFQIFSVIDLFGKAGFMFWSTERVHNESIGTSGTDFFWGLGAGAHLGPVGLRLEWESVALGSPDNLSMASLSATIGF